MAVFAIAVCFLFAKAGCYHEAAEMILGTGNEMKQICNVCNGVIEEKLVSGVRRNNTSYDVFFCRKCRTGTTLPVPSAEELAQLYSSGNYRSTEGGRRFNPLIEFFISLSGLMKAGRIEKYVRRGRLLDIGCGRGLFLHTMRGRGWEVKGVEFSEDTARSVIETYGIDVRAGSPEGWGFCAESFDVITISHVLEHVEKPVEMINECRRILQKNGLLVIAVPNISSLQAAAGKGAWFQLDLPYHLSHFSEEGLAELLKKNFYKIVKIRRFDLEHNPFGWLQTLLNMSGIEGNLFYDLLKRRTSGGKRFSECRKSDLFRTFALLPFYLPLSLVLSVFESFVLKRGGTIEVYAVKG
jgi:2-polyprenyl-3-methyl-5-hydroxy-6-metoxy-1,4-benzoquinol methylase